MEGNERSAQMLLDYDNMFREFSKAISIYNIDNIPVLFESPDPDHRTLTYFIKKNEDQEAAANKVISILKEDDQMDALVEAKRKGEDGWEQGYKILPNLLEESTRKLLKKGVQIMVSREKSGRSKKYFFIPLKMLSEHSKKLIESKFSYEQFFKTAADQISSTLKEMGEEFVSQVKQR